MASTAVAWLDETRVLVGQGQFVMLVDGRSGGLVTRCRVLRAAVVHSLENIPGEDSWVVRGGTGGSEDSEGEVLRQTKVLVASEEPQGETEQK